MPEPTRGRVAERGRPPLPGTVRPAEAERPAAPPERPSESARRVAAEAGRATPSEAERWKALESAGWGESEPKRRPAAKRRAGAPPERGRRPEREPVGRPRRPGPARRSFGTERMNAGAIVFSIITGLALLAIVERSVIEGGPIGDSGPAGAERPLSKPNAKAALPDRSPQKQAPSRQGGGGTTGGGAAAVPDLQVLTSQIRELTVAQRGAAARQEYGVPADKPPLVVVSRVSRDRTWAFGTTALPVPAGRSSMPHVALFAARWTAGRWQPALSGTTAFAGIVGRMPPAMMSVSEASLLSKHSAMTAGQGASAANGTRVGDGLMLPWRVGASWTLGATEGAGARPLAALAFTGGDGQVAAAGDGRLYRFCAAGSRGFVMVIHPSGLASAYYRMRDVAQLRDGSVVKQGDPLGRTGGDLPCGGAPAPRAEVQFALRGASENVPLDGAQLGGWIFRERARPLLGFAERGLLQVLPGAPLANLGPVPPTEPPGPADQPAPGARPSTPPADGTQKGSSNSADEEQ
ncbi:hypothetical protein ACGFNU_12195 [Spirillospora sp. NPDC048911]|uniref:hypothetical protein n=1 Tax=Spirillospora sp. NPDC048911 TaxID=3364527 RepID=UPI0037187C28